MYTPSFALKNAGYDLTFLLQQLVVDHPEAHRQLMSQLPTYKAVVFQRPALPVAELWMAACRHHGVKTVYEVDDDLFNIAYANPAFSVWGQTETKRRSTRLIQASDLILVSTETLKACVVEHAAVDPGRVIVAPNHLRHELWGEDVQRAVTTTAAREPGQVVIGWQGSPTHESDFCVAVPAILELLKQQPQVVLRFFGCIPQLLKPLSPSRVQIMAGVEFAQYPRTLKYLDFDIGLAPLLNTAFNRSKSPLKYLEYSALGVPTIASACEPYRVITHGETGLLCRTGAEWYAALTSLVTDAHRRRAMGAAAKAYVWRHWGPAHGQVWVKALHQLVAEPAYA